MLKLVECTCRAIGAALILTAFVVAITCGPKGQSRLVGAALPMPFLTVTYETLNACRKAHDGAPPKWEFQMVMCVVPFLAAMCAAPIHWSSADDAAPAYSLALAASLWVFGCHIHSQFWA